jgi:beta-N-acetylhexosaminidase
MTDIYRLACGVVCVGFDGSLQDALQDTPFAGVVLFARNVPSLDATRDLTAAIRSALGDELPPIVAIDQEGGRVARIRDRVSIFPPMLALGATRDKELARRAGAQIGFDLRRAGVNVDFAPVLDLALDRLNTVIGTRAFGDDPSEVAALAGALAAGLRESGIVATYKHFPGHGSSAVDSHLDLPVVDVSADILEQRDLAPFAQLLPDAQAVMTAHIVLTAWDAAMPATLSPAILTGLLRQRLKFSGVCFTDCMEMNAIAGGVGTAAGAVQALTAGADCVLMSHSTGLAREAIARIVQAVERGVLPRERLEEAHARVAALRRTLAAPLPVDAAPPYPQAGDEIGRRAVTVLRGDPRIDPARCIAVSFESETVEGAQGVHASFAPFGRRFGVELVRVPLDLDGAQCSELLEKLKAAGKRPVLLMRRAHVYAGQENAVRVVLEAFPNAVIVSLREPYDALLFENARHTICTYGDEAPSIAGLEAVMLEGAPAVGVFPVKAGIAVS